MMCKSMEDLWLEYYALLASEAQNGGFSRESTLHKAYLLCRTR